LLLNKNSYSGAGKTLPFLGGDVVGNLLKLLAALGSNGIVGLVAIAIILYLFNRK
jgi:hypothetical protein